MVWKIRMETKCLESYKIPKIPKKAFIVNKKKIKSKKIIHHNCALKNLICSFLVQQKSKNLHLKLKALKMTFLLSERNYLLWYEVFVILIIYIILNYFYNICSLIHHYSICFYLFNLSILSLFYTLLYLSIINVNCIFYNCYKI